jgi:hypothetical protein
MTEKEFYNIKPGDWINESYAIGKDTHTYKVLHREFENGNIYMIIKDVRLGIDTLHMPIESRHHLSFNHELMKQEKVNKAIKGWTS